MKSGAPMSAITAPTGNSIGATTVRITPVLYALGSLIALVSFAFVAFYLLFFERERRRFYGGSVAEEDEEETDEAAEGTTAT